MGRGRPLGRHQAAISAMPSPAPIVRIGTITRVREFDGALRSPLRRWTRKEMLLVLLEDGNGAVGVGECWLDGGRAETLAAFIHKELAPQIVGQPAAPREFAPRMLARAFAVGRGDIWHAAVSGADIAMWDLLGQQCGLPLYRLLGGNAGRAPVYGSGGMYGQPPEALAAEAQGALAWAGGYKLKAGGASIGEDRARVAAVRDANPDARLILDFMFAPDYADALRRLRSVGEFDLACIETPTAIDDIEGWASLHRLTGMPLSGPEIGAGLRMHRDYLAAGAVQVLQFDLSLCGGLSRGQDLAGLARAFARPFALHCAGSGILFAASAQFAAACSDVDSIERHLLHDDLFDRLIEAGYGFRDGAVYLPETSGLGLGELWRELGAPIWYRP